MDGKELVSGAAYDVYMDIKKRTNGEIYFGVVGPVRTGKSTFIKRFMELCVLPSMKDDNKRKRAQDELPQSSGGTTVMTVEPKFIPSEAALISPFEGINMKVRLVDCVGFMVEGANGHLDNGKERMVKTPWDTKEIAFSKAAEIGTKKVINDHSTIGIVVTTDGSFTEIDRTNYVAAEKKTINELKNPRSPVYAEELSLRSSVCRILCRIRSIQDMLLHVPDRKYLFLLSLRPTLLRYGSVSPDLLLCSFRLDQPHAVCGRSHGHDRNVLRNRLL